MIMRGFLEFQRDNGQVIKADAGITRMLHDNKIWS